MQFRSLCFSMLGLLDPCLPSPPTHTHTHTTTIINAPCQPSFAAQPRLSFVPQRMKEDIIMERVPPLLNHIVCRAEQTQRATACHPFLKLPLLHKSHCLPSRTHPGGNYRPILFEPSPAAQITLPAKQNTPRRRLQTNAF